MAGPASPPAVKGFGGCCSIELFPQVHFGYSFRWQPFPFWDPPTGVADAGTAVQGDASAAACYFVTAARWRGRTKIPAYGPAFLVVLHAVFFCGHAEAEGRTPRNSQAAPGLPRREARM